MCAVDKSLGHHKHRPYVGLEHIESHTGRLADKAEVRVVKSATFAFTPEHVLYGRLRPYLNKVLLPDFKGHCSTEIFPLRPGPGLSRPFLQYWLRSDAIVEKCHATSTGTRMPRANVNAILRLGLLLPPVPEQRRIVGILDEAFAAIATAKANAERNLHNARALFAAHRHTALTRGGGGWESRRLAELCDIKHGFTFKSEYFTSAGAHVLLTAGNFHEAGGYRDRRAKQKYYAGPIPEGFVLSQGDMLVAMTEQAAGLLGSPILVPPSGKFLHNQRLGLVSGKAGVPWLNEYFFHVFNTPAVRQAIHASASGVKVRHTSPTKIGQVVVTFPTSLREQRRIVAAIQGLDAETGRLESINQRKLAALDALKSSLLHQAFSGQL